MNPKSNSGQKSILIVDDMPANLQLLAEILSQEGYRVRPATNGERALASIDKELPDLILLDIMMPGLDGFAICRQLKADARTREIPVIFLSALSETFDKVMAFQVGGVDYVTKPFQLEEVLARVRTHLRLEAMRRQLHEQNRQLHQRNVELDNFASIVAHDLKNPLATLITTLTLAQHETQAEAAPEASIEQTLAFGINIAHKMAVITDELLLLATLRQDAVVHVPLRMDEIVANVLKQLQALINLHQPVIQLPIEWPVALGYAPWIEVVWANYISNALRHGQQPNQVLLGADRLEGGLVRFWVRDTGPGLSPQAQAQLFTESAQFDPQRSRVGHGLGLSIVRRIMDKLGGGYGVCSELQQGSKFYFILRSNN